MRGVGWPYRWIAFRASAFLLTAAAVLALLPSAVAGAVANQRPSAAATGPTDHGDDGATAWKTAPLPLSEALHQQQPSPTSAESVGWKSWVPSAERGRAIRVRLARGLSRRNPATPISPRRSLEILFCTWQV